MKFENQMKEIQTIQITISIFIFVFPKQISVSQLIDLFIRYLSIRPPIRRRTLYEFHFHSLQNQFVFKMKPLIAYKAKQQQKNKT